MGGVKNHFVAIIACFEGPNGNAVMRLHSSPSIGAECHRDYFESTLTYYNLTFANISSLVADNYNTNKSISRLTGKEFV
jgi:hypothetical protein